MISRSSNKDLYSLAFALTETSLYLDGHPNCKKALEYYKKAKAMYEEELEKYESEHGPISTMSDNVIDNGSWQWIDTPWPWQNDISM